jgi:hypothetical protein
MHPDIQSRFECSHCVLGILGFIPAMGYTLGPLPFCEGERGLCKFSNDRKKKREQITNLVGSPFSHPIKESIDPSCREMDGAVTRSQTLSTSRQIGRNPSSTLLMSDFDVATIQPPLQQLIDRRERTKLNRYIRLDLGKWTYIAEHDAV